MHELSIAMRILNIAAEESSRRDGAAIRAIHVKLGPLAGVVQEALTTAFECAREGTPFCGTRLVIEEAPLVGYCSECRCERPLWSIQNMSCVECNSPAYKLISGNELEIETMEIELPDDADRLTSDPRQN